MHAMILEKPRVALQEREIPEPPLGIGDIKAKVLACGVCRTDLHVVDGELPHPKLPLIPGHEIIAKIVECGPQVQGLSIGTRVAIPWLGWTCGYCRYCRAGAENLCDNAKFTGYTLNGGYAEFLVANADYCFPVTGSYYDDPVKVAPLICAGLIGYRSLVMAGTAASKLGLYGFGAAAHIIAQAAVYEGHTIYAFTRPGKHQDQAFAKSLGAVWAGGSDELPPEQLDAAIIFAPTGSLVPLALRAVRKGGRVVCGGIHMSDIPSFPYSLLWEERQIYSVANLTRNDAQDFLTLAPKVGIKTETEPFPMSQANEALAKLRGGRVLGAVVLVPDW